MTTYEASCVFCVYTDDHEWMRPRLSGLGIRGPEADHAPADAASRYDDPDLDPSTLKDIWLLRASFGTPSPAVPPEVTPPAWGFPFHASCWNLWSALHHLDEADIQALNNLCRSCPQQGSRLNWGHNYGGLERHKIDPNELLPGEECEVDGGFNLDYAAGESLIDSIYLSDPLDIPGLQQLLHQSSNPEKLVNEQGQEALSISLDNNDCFTLLPLEILQETLLLLPSRDVLNLKLASKVFATTPLPEPFWASRFLPGFEFDCMFEMQNYSTKPHCWKNLYLGVRTLRNSPNFKNRHRIWKLLLELESLLFSLSSTTLDGSPSASFFEPDAPEDDLSWISASGRLVDPEESFQKGCRALWTRTVAVPNSVSGIFVSFVRFSNVLYVSGFRFRQRSGPDICLGYRFPRNEFPIQTDASARNANGFSISGFEFAIDPKGIRAISLITNMGQRSEWLGNPKGIPKRRLVARHQTLTALKGSFDALKLVSLGISENILENNDESTPLAGTLSLRDTAQWFPEIPDEQYFLNEASFLDMPRHVLDYRPFTVVPFGGLQGRNLSNLTGIAVWIVNFNQIYGIDFLYNTEINGQKVHTLGRHGPFSDDEPRSYESCNNSTDQRITFEIDGPGGEIINRVDIQEDRAWFSNQLQGFRVHTNRGRTATFPPEPDLRDDLPLLPVSIANSTVITGFYGRLESHVVLLNLGLMSERI